MSALWSGEELLQPISADQPCGQNLEDTQLLASFDAFRLYGRTKPLEATADGESTGPKTLEDRDEQPPDWLEIKEKSTEALRQSKDLRLLVHLGTALLRTDGLPAFLETIKVAAQWLDGYWEQTFPMIDGDGILRRSALNCFADPIAVVEAVRRAPLVDSRQHGRFSLRDIDIAAGQLQPGKGDTRTDEAQINGAFAALPLEEITGLQQQVTDALKALNAVDQKVRGQIGTEAAPTFDSLSSQLSKIDRFLRAQMAARPEAAGDTESEGESEGAGTGTRFTGVVRSRTEAVRALEAVAEYFRKNEPSSPVPMFCDRAKRLVAKEFLEVLADIAPEAVGQARAAGGVRD
jgi:type VI secretion system protein ImpA